MRRFFEMPISKEGRRGKKAAMRNSLKEVALQKDRKEEGEEEPHSPLYTACSRRFSVRVCPME